MDYQENGIKYSKSNFYDLYKEIQNEIKDKVISKLLFKLQNMYKEIDILKTENISLKNHLSYILKRIILHKNEYNFINNKANSNTNQNNLLTNSINMKKSTMNNTSIFKSSFCKGSQSSFKHLRSVENYRVITEEDLFFSPPSKKKKSKDKSIKDEEYVYDQPNSSTVDQKINGYLNTLYRNNFVTGNKGVSNNYNLNSKKTIYEELFPSNNKKKYKTINYDESYTAKKIKRPKFHTNLSQRGNSMLKKNGGLSNKRSMNNINKKEKEKKHPIRIKDYREEQIAGTYFDTSTLNFDDNEFDYKFDFEDNYYTSKNSTGKKSKKTNHHKNPKNNYGEKIKAKKGLLYMKRSPFLVNKF
jgi:hypothetical protein